MSRQGRELANGTDMTFVGEYTYPVFDGRQIFDARNNKMRLAERYHNRLSDRQSNPSAIEDSQPRNHRVSHKRISADIMMVQGRPRQKAHQLPK